MTGVTPHFAKCDQLVNAAVFGVHYNQHPSIVSRSRRAVANATLAEEATMHECE